MLLQQHNDVIKKTYYMTVQKKMFFNENKMSLHELIMSVLLTKNNNTEQKNNNIGQKNKEIGQKNNNTGQKNKTVGVANSQLDAQIAVIEE